jgi:hypothetical protein
MSGPDGSPTKRDARRNARRAQFEMQQAERRRERERRIRRQRVQRYAIIGVSILLLLLVGFLIIHAVIGSGGTAPHHGSSVPAAAEAWDGQDGPPLRHGQMGPERLIMEGKVVIHYSWAPPLRDEMPASVPLSGGYSLLGVG